MDNSSAPSDVSLNNTSQNLPNTSSRNMRKLILNIFAMLLFGLLVGAGVYVWQHAKVDDASSKIAQLQSQLVSSQNQVSNLSKQAQQAASSTDPTANWKTYNSQDGSFSLKYPTNWITASNPAACSNNIVLLAPSSGSIGKCGTDGMGEITVSYSSHGCFPLDSSYSNLSKESVTVSGVSGERDVGTTTSSTNVFVPAGTKVVQYCFPKGSGGYSATYTQQPSYPDVLTDFDLMVTKTLKFNK